MNRPMNRNTLSRWRNRFATLLAVGGVAVFMPILPVFPQAPTSIMSPQIPWSPPTPEMRMQAISVLAAQNWQYNRDMEDLLVKTLRGDVNESVRLRAAQAMFGASSLTPRAFAACQAIVSGDLSDGFAMEKSVAVRAVADESLRKHGAAKSPGPRAVQSLGSPIPVIPAGVPSVSPAKIAFLPTGTGRTAVSTNLLKATGAEESQFNEMNAVKYPSLHISQPPAPCACDANIVAETPQPGESIGSKLLGRFTKRDKASEVVVVPAQAATVQPAARTAGPSTPATSSQAAVQAVSQASASSPLTTSTEPILSLQETRVELRKEGLRNLGVAELAATASRTPPPVTVASSLPSEGGMLRRWFGSGPERANEIKPVTATAPSEGGFLQRWIGWNRENVETTQPTPQYQPAR